MVDWRREEYKTGARGEICRDGEGRGTELKGTAGQDVRNIAEVDAFICFILMEMVSFFISVIFEYMSIRLDPNEGRVLCTRVAKHLHKLVTPVSVPLEILFIWTKLQGG